MAKKTAKKTAKKVPNRAANISPNETFGTPRPAAAAAGLAKPEIKKIQGLLKSKTADGASRLDCRCSNRSVRRGPTTRRCLKRR